MDAVTFIRDVFTGRQRSSPSSCMLWPRIGLSKGTVRKALRQLCYHHTKDGRTPGTPWYYVNRNKYWKDETPVIREADLREAAYEKAETVDWDIEPDPVIQKEARDDVGDADDGLAMRTTRSNELALWRAIGTKLPP